MTSKVKSVKWDKEDAESEVDSLHSKLHQAKGDAKDQIAMLLSQLAKSCGSVSGAQSLVGGRKKVRGIM